MPESIERLGPCSSGSVSGPRNLWGIFDRLTALESEVRWQGTDREVRYALFSRVGFTDELRTVVDERPDASLYGVPELATLFESER